MSDSPSSSNPSSAERDPRVYFAAERTFLAWIRTGLALMGFGFVVARFGLFLREFGMKQSQSPHATGISLWLGTALVLLGVVVNISAVIRHLQIVRELRSGEWIAGRPSRVAVTVSLILAALGLGMALYLVLVR